MFYKKLLRKGNTFDSQCKVTEPDEADLFPNVEGEEELIEEYESFYD